MGGIRWDDDNDNDDDDDDGNHNNDNDDDDDDANGDDFCFNGDQVAFNRLLLNENCQGLAIIKMIITKDNDNKNNQGLAITGRA